MRQPFQVAPVFTDERQMRILKRSIRTRDMPLNSC
jgi:hypothetical protein